jgi:hypothetical protein
MKEGIQQTIDTQSEWQVKKVVIKPGHGTEALVLEFWIKREYLEKLQDLGTLRAGDEFTFSKNPDGSAVMYKIRNHVWMGEKKINHRYNIPKDAIRETSPSNVTNKDTLSQKKVIKDILTPEEKEWVADIFDGVRVGSGFIEYKWNKISINTKPWMELDVQSLIAQMIIRARFDIKKGWIVQTIREGMGKPYYENSSNDIEAKNRLIDTTIVKRETLAKLFSFKKPMTGPDVAQEEKVVADLLVNFVNAIVAKEIQVTV